MDPRKYNCLIHRRRHRPSEEGQKLTETRKGPQVRQVGSRLIRGAGGGVKGALRGLLKSGDHGGGHSLVVSGVKGTRGGEDRAVTRGASVREEKELSVHAGQEVPTGEEPR